MNSLRLPRSRGLSHSRSPPKAPQKKRNKSRYRSKTHKSSDDLEFLTDFKALSIQNKSSTSSKRQIQTFKRLSFIGKGSFGVVCSVRSDDSHCKYKGIEIALKVSRSIRYGRSNGGHQVELEILKKLQSKTYHANICKFLFYGFDAEGRLHQGFEYCPNGTLEQLIECQPQTLKSLPILQLLIQINNGLIHIHQNDIVHLDLKPENIFIANSSGGSFHIKIGDFGISTLIRDRDQKTLKMCSGDPIYIAPEILDSLSNVHNICSDDVENIKKVDIFSLGIIMLEMMYDVNLPSQGTQFAYLRNIEKNETIEWSEFGEDSKENDQLKLKHIVSKMLWKDPKDRVSSTQLCTEIEYLFKPLEIQTSFAELSKLEVRNRQQLQHVDADDALIKDTFEVFVDTSEPADPEELLSELTDFTLVHTEQQLNTAFLLY